MSLDVLPVTVQLPAGYTLPAGGSQGTTATSSPSGPADVVSIGSGVSAGTFTAVSGDTYRLGNLFKGGAAAGQSVAGYRVALGSGSGQLLLDNADVSDRTSFTAAEFARLTYTAGDDQTQQNLTVVAQTGKTLPGGALYVTADSQAVQITADVTGSRSINAMNALSATPTDADADAVAMVKEANILTGVGSPRPTLQTPLTPGPAVPASEAAAKIGQYRTTVANSTASVVDLSSYYPTAIGSSMSMGSFTNAANSLITAMLLAGDGVTGAFWSSANFNLQTEVVKAYNITKSLG